MTGEQAGHPKEGPPTLAALARQEAEHAVAAAAGSNDVGKHEGASRAVLRAAQVAALDGSGAGAQSVVMMPPTVVPLPLGIASLRDELVDGMRK